MAITLSKDINAKRGRDTIRIAPKDLIIDPAKRGREFPPSVQAVRELANDIKTTGQRQPITVGKTPDKKLEVIAGFTRVEAVLLLDAEEPAAGWMVECLVFEGNADEQFIANINENRIRNQATAIDDAHNVRRLSRDFGKTDEEILAIYGGKSQAWLDHTIRPLLTLSREQQKAIHEGSLRAAGGLVLAKMAPEDREQALADAKKESKGATVTATAILKQARSKGTLAVTTSLKPSEVKTAHVWLGENTDNPKVKKFCKAYAEYTAGVLPEPDYYRIIKKLLSE